MEEFSSSGSETQNKTWQLFLPVWRHAHGLRLIVINKPA